MPCRDATPKLGCGASEGESCDEKERSLAQQASMSSSTVTVASTAQSLFRSSSFRSKIAQ
jgi:hypothetical protein